MPCKGGQTVEERSLERDSRHLHFEATDSPRNVTEYLVADGSGEVMSAKPVHNACPHAKEEEQQEEDSHYSNLELRQPDELESSADEYVTMGQHSELDRSQEEVKKLKHGTGPKVSAPPKKNRSKRKAANSKSGDDAIPRANYNKRPKRHGTHRVDVENQNFTVEIEEGRRELTSTSDKEYRAEVQLNVSVLAYETENAIKVWNLVKDIPGNRGLTILQKLLRRTSVLTEVIRRSLTERLG